MQIEVLAEGVVSDMVGFMWQHRCWGMATQVAGLKADFMTIFVEVTPPWPLSPCNNTPFARVRADMLLRVVECRLSPASQTQPQQKSCSPAFHSSLDMSAANTLTASWHK